MTVSLHTWVQLGADGLAFGALGASYMAYRKARRFLREARACLASSRSDAVEALIQAADASAARLCPFCAQYVEQEDTPIREFGVIYNDQQAKLEDIQPEHNGYHAVMLNDKQMEMPCLAAPLKKFCRDLFDEMMNEKTKVAA